MTDDRMDQATPEWTTVRIGQLWASNDSRDIKAGRCQRLRVEAVVEGSARLSNLDTGRLTTIATRRMRPNSTGYRMVGPSPFQEPEEHPE